MKKADDNNNKTMKKQEVLSDARAGSSPSSSDQPSKRGRRKLPETPVIPLAERIRSYRKKAGLSQMELGKRMGVTRNTVVNWEAGKYRPDADLFPQLCDVLQVSLNELFGMNPAAQQGILEDEWCLLSGYRQLSPLGKRILRRTADSILEEEEKEHEQFLEKNIRIIDFLSTAAAAGDGYGYSDIPVEDYRFIYLSARNSRANGMIRVKGDSMLPVYHDGDLVYVQYTNSAQPGEDVLVSSVAGMHIKRLGESGVYSLNKQLPFTLTSPDDHVQVVGRILGIVSSSDCPSQEDCDLLQEIRREEIKEYRIKRHIS